jgi:hypothetical protein
MDYSATTLWFSSQCVTDRIYFSGMALSWPPINEPYGFITCFLSLWKPVSNSFLSCLDDTLSLISNEGKGENLVGVIEGVCYNGYYTNVYPCVSTGASQWQHSRCVYSKYPFTRWFLCQASAVDIAKNPKHRYLSFLHDRHQHTGLLLSHTEVPFLYSLHTQYQSNVWTHLLTPGFFLYFLYFLHCRIISEDIKTMK